MREGSSQRVYNQALCARVAKARVDSGYTQAQMADLLGIGKDAYIKYEKRSPLPHFLIARFAALTNHSPLFILTGSNTWAEQTSPKKSRTRKAG